MAKRGPHKTLIQRSREKSDEEKAIYHQQQGAGRSRVLRKFLGLTEADKDSISERLKMSISRKLQQTNR